MYKPGVYKGQSGSELGDGKQNQHPSDIRSRPPASARSSSRWSSFFSKCVRTETEDTSSEQTFILKCHTVTHGMLIFKTSFF